MRQTVSARAGGVATGVAAVVWLGWVGGSGIARGQPAIRPVALSGQAAPGIENRTFGTFGQPVVGVTGQVWFTATLAGFGPGPTSGLFRANPGQAPMAVYVNGQVPGLVPSRVWSSWTNLVAGDTDEVMFFSQVSRTDIGGTFTGVFRGEPGAVEMVAATGELAPGRSEAFFSMVQLSGAPGLRLALRALTSASGDNSGVWANTVMFGLAAHEGEPVIEFPGVNFGDMQNGVTPSISPGTSPVVNMAGEVTFKSALAGAVSAGTNEAVFYGIPGIMWPIAREGEPVVAAGAPAGATWLLVGPPSMNDAGVLAFNGVMTGGGVTAANDEALFVGRIGELVMVLREDDAAPGLQGLRLHERDSAVNIWTFRNVVINNAGKVGFITGLTGSGINNANDAAVYVGTPGNWTLAAREGEQAAGAAPGETYGNFIEMGLSRGDDVAMVTLLGGVNRALVAGPLGMHGLIARRGGTVQVAPGDARTIGGSLSDFQFGVVTGGSDGRSRSFSNAGNLAFRARFTNSTEGVFETTLRPVVQPPGDRDGDGIRDDWEEGPIDINEDGVVDLDLAALGADPDRKDLFLEVDIQDITGLSITAMDHVILAFEYAPVPNPAGAPGITLHIMRSDVFSGPDVWALPSPGDLPWLYHATKNQWFGDAADRVSPNALWRLEARRRTMRYAMVIGRVDGDAYYGNAELNGDDMLLVFGHPTMSADIDRAATLMHELGHLLGLRHGGGDEVNLKPNYPSVMNYALSKRYAFNQGFFRVDYCREALPTLNEAALDETLGVGTAGSTYADFQMPFSALPPGGSMREIRYARLNGSPTDFSNPVGLSLDGMFTNPVGQDLNQMPPGCPIPAGSEVSYGEVMQGQNDWDRISLRILKTGNYAQSRAQAGGFAEPSPALAAWIDANFPTPPGGCVADFNGSGQVSVQDIFDFLAAYFMGDARADVNGSGAITVQDIFDFLAAYFMGCP